MRILLSIGSFHPGHGGPYFSVGNLAKYLASSGHEVLLLTVDYLHLPVQPSPEGVVLESVSAKLMPGVRQSWIPGCQQWLDHQIKMFKPDIIHDNGLWLTLNHQIARAAKRNNIPLVLSPRGCLDPWAMSYRNWKKRIALGLYQRHDLEDVTCFHAASELEAESIRKMGLKQPIGVIPNGVDLPEWAAEDRRWKMEDRKRMQESEKTEDGKTPISDLPTSNSLPRSVTRYALFIGRLHPIKNIPTLLRAWAEVKPEGWILRIVGSDEVGHRADLEKLARELGISEQIKFMGPIYGNIKEEIFRSSELAFLVSKSENFGIAAAEALAAGIPVIASKTTPWACLEEENMGWWVDGSVSGVSEALRKFFTLPEMEYHIMSERSQVYAERSFSWKVIAERFKELYESLS